MVAKNFPPALAAKQKRLERVKNYIGQDVSEQAQIDRAPVGPLRERGKPPTPPVVKPIGKTITVPQEKPMPAPSRRRVNDPDMFVTRGTRKQFMADHPVLASKSGAARDKFLANHPKISANVSEFDANKQTRRQRSIMGRLRRSL